MIAPEFIKSSRKNFIYYKPFDSESIKRSIESAKNFDREKIDLSEVSDWKDLTNKLINE